MIYEEYEVNTMKVLSMQVAPLGTNCYILCDEEAKCCAVVDPGGDANRIAAAIDGREYALTAILLTHAHYDHTGAVAELRRRYPGAALYLNRRDAELLGQPIPGAMSDHLFPALPGPVLDCDDGDTIAVGGLQVQVLHTPGHSPGSVVFRCENVLFTGDTLFAGSCGRTDLYGGSMKEMLSSLRRLGQLEGNFTVLPGHMEPSDLDMERSTNYYMTMAMRG